MRPSICGRLRAVAVNQLCDAQPRDFALLLGGNPQFAIGCVVEPPLERLEHLGRRLAAGADDENVTEARRVLAVRSGKTIAQFDARAGNARLFLRRPRLGSRPSGAWRPVSTAHPNLRVRGKGLAPV